MIKEFLTIYFAFISAGLTMMAADRYIELKQREKREKEYKRKSREN